MVSFIFVVKHYLYNSEYGGLTVIIAKDSEEAFNLLCESAAIEYEKDPERQWIIDEFREQLLSASVHELKEETASGIVNNFST